MLVYNPQYGAPLTPAPGTVAVSTQRSFAPNFRQDTFFQTGTTVQRSLGKHWALSAEAATGQDWKRAILRNINAPLVGTSSNSDPVAALQAPRPLGPGVNLFVYQSTGHLAGVLRSSARPRPVTVWALSPSATAP